MAKFFIKYYDKFRYPIKWEFITYNGKLSTIINRARKNTRFFVWVYYIRPDGSRLYVGRSDSKYSATLGKFKGFWIMARKMSEVEKNEKRLLNVYRRKILSGSFDPNQTYNYNDFQKYLKNKKKRL